MDAVKLSPQIIAACSKDLEEKDLKRPTLLAYNRAWRELYEFLPDGKVLNEESIAAWEDSLEDRFAPASRNARMSAVNQLLRFCEARDLSLTTLPRVMKDWAELTRADYLRILKKLDEQDDRLVYMAARAIVILGLNYRDFSRLTTEACEAGYMILKDGSVRRIPDSFKRELLDYARSRGISGVILVTRSGKKLIDHTNLDKILADTAAELGLSCSVSMLKRLYDRRMEECWQAVKPSFDAMYDDGLERENVYLQT